MLRALDKGDEADKVLKQFGMKTPLQGVSEEGEEGEDAPPKPANGSPAKGKAKKGRPLPIEDTPDVD